MTEGFSQPRSCPVGVETSITQIFCMRAGMGSGFYKAKTLRPADSLLIAVKRYLYDCASKSPNETDLWRGSRSITWTLLKVWLQIWRQLDNGSFLIFKNIADTGWFQLGAECYGPSHPARETAVILAGQDPTRHSVPKASPSPLTNRIATRVRPRRRGLHWRFGPKSSVLPVDSAYGSFWFSKYSGNWRVPL
jgi:hypothetical protein